MKSMKLAFIAAGIVLSVSAYSQTGTTPTDSSKHSTDQPSVGSSAATTDASAKPIQTFPAPNLGGRYYIAVLGNYQSSSESASVPKSVAISGDEQNPGKVWIDGLTDAKIYALRKPTPGTYKIPAQKVGDKSVAEGTLIYDDSNKQVNICLGCNYSDENPSAAFMATGDDTNNKKQHKPVIVSFTGNKTDAGTASVSR